MHRLLIGALEEILERNTDPNLVDKLDYCLALSRGLQHYVPKQSTPPTDIQKKINSDTAVENWQEIYDNGLLPTFTEPVSKEWMTDSYAGTFLRLMAQATNAERVLEIGMFTGHSAVSFATSKKVKEVICLENEKLFENYLRERISETELNDKIHVKIGPAMESLKQLKSENTPPFDIIFIDADKESNLSYYKFVMDNGLLQPRGMILVDNVLKSGTALSIPGLDDEIGKDIHEFNEFVSKDPRVYQVMIPLRDGITIILLKE